jgi:hypothetical protein
MSQGQRSSYIERAYSNLLEKIQIRECTQQEIAALLNFSGSTVGELVRRWEQMNLIVQTERTLGKKRIYALTPEMFQPIQKPDPRKARLASLVPEGYISLPEFARQRNMKPQTVHSLCARNHIPYIRIPFRKQIFIRSDIEIKSTNSFRGGWIAPGQRQMLPC